eukprot:TRINITY_DN54_c0_g1_i1.p1 TRINITY_DN54_c0_g1~~TRINITY_DN54_c0_g1_i1.p1  ORF type:complete len:261 (-),score=68.78 TRINITY_DN54_c0_g1_i1:627-1409(-)
MAKKKSNIPTLAELLAMGADTKPKPTRPVVNPMATPMNTPISFTPEEQASIAAIKLDPNAIDPNAGEVVLLPNGTLAIPKAGSIPRLQRATSAYDYVFNNGSMLDRPTDFSTDEWTKINATLANQASDKRTENFALQNKLRNATQNNAMISGINAGPRSGSAGLLANQTRGRNLMGMQNQGAEAYEKAGLDATQKNHMGNVATANQFGRFNAEQINTAAKQTIANKQAAIDRRRQSELSDWELVNKDIAGGNIGYAINPT